MKKMKFYLFAFVVFISTLSVTAQVAINKDGSNATSGTILDVKSSAALKEHVVVQDATGYFGIGTINPQSRLDVWGSIRGSIDISNYVELTAAPILTGPLAGTLEGQLKVTGPATQRYSFIFENGGVSDTLFSLVRATGNIGIGTTLPAGKLHVSASTIDVAAGRASIGIETGGFQSWLGMALESASIPGDPEPFIGYGPPTESFRIIQVNPLGPGTEMRMFFHPLGPVGIGDPSTHTIPTAALQVSNRNDSWPIFNLLDNDVNVMTVLDGGNVGIGVIGPTSKLEVAGDIYATADITTDTDVWADNVYTLTNVEAGEVVQVGTEVNRTAQGTSDLIPIAYGSIQADGTITSGSGNFTCTYSGTFTNYEIAITGESYSNIGYTTVITPVNSGSPVARTSTARETSTSGHLLVYIWNLSGNRVQSDFSFIVYKP
jgi:hypothetical protein